MGQTSRPWSPLWRDRNIDGNTRTSAGDITCTMACTCIYMCLYEEYIYMCVCVCVYVVMWYVLPRVFDLGASPQRFMGGGLGFGLLTVGFGLWHREIWKGKGDSSGRATITTRMMGALGKGQSGRAGRACGLSTVSHVQLRATLPASLPAALSRRDNLGRTARSQVRAEEADRPASGRADLFSWRRACPQR